MRDINAVVDQLIAAMGEGDEAAQLLRRDRAALLRRDEYCAPEYRPEWQRLQAWLNDHCADHPRRQTLVGIFNSPTE